MSAQESPAIVLSEHEIADERIKGGDRWVGAARGIRKQDVERKRIGGQDTEAMSSDALNAISLAAWAVGAKAFAVLAPALRRLFADACKCPKSPRRRR